MLTLPKPIADAICAHAERDYPNECCGVLLGSFSENVSVLAEAVAAANAAESARNRYRIAPAEIARIATRAHRQDLEVVGFYHSHPDHPASWPATDLAEAHWLGCVYLITEVRQGKAIVTSAFLLAGESEETKYFLPVGIAAD